MGSTALYAFPYPDKTEPRNVPLDLQELAQAVETKIAALEAAGGTVILGDTKVSAAGGQASIDFSSIPSTYSSLRLICHLRTTDAANSRFMQMRFNGVASGYDYIMSTNSDTGLAQTESLNQPQGVPGQMSGAGTTTLHFSPCEIIIPAYADVGASMRRTWISYWGMQVGTIAAGALRNGLTYGVWRTLAAINQVTIFALAGNLAQNSRVTLFGHKAI